jgi:hypothetical protein
LSPGDIESVKIEYSINNGADWIEIVASTENDGSFDWEVPNNPSDECLVKISDVDSDPSDESDAVFTITPPICEGDFEPDGDVDGSDLAVFAADFGRTDCAIGPPCEGDFDGDNDVDGSDLAVFAADFGRTDCPVCIVAPIPVTGQQTSYAVGDDGDLQMGVTWPVPRFTDNEDGTVTDNLTGLIWLKNANCGGGMNWANALTYCSGLASGSCGLADDSSAGDWLLPNVRELHSLIDFSNYNLALPSGHLFTGVQSSSYWSSTTVASHTYVAWRVYMVSGHMYDGSTEVGYYVWPVRGGN